jgi:hypothetical protein
MRQGPRLIACFGVPGTAGYRGGINVGGCRELHRRIDSFGCCGRMILIARPKGGETVPFLRDRHWVIGQAYVMSTLLLFVLGAAVVIINRP